MKDSFADTLKQFRTEKNLSQQQLADMLFVERSTIANWETGRRIPDAVLLLRISKCLDMDINILLETIDNTVEEPNIIMVDDESIILKGGMSVIGHLLPNALVTGFTSPTICFPTLWSQALLLRQKRCHSPNPTAYIWLISISKWASLTGLNCAVRC